MKALRFDRLGQPSSVLKIEQCPTPQPTAGEVLVRVSGAAINPSDPKNVQGAFKQTTLPRTPGRDFAGVVTVGESHIGKEVWGSAPQLGLVRDGSHAEFVVVPEKVIAPKPKSLSMLQAAAVGVPYFTAWASLIHAAQVQAGETILITGAAGAVGRAAIQIANWRKLRVIGAALSSEPIEGTIGVINTKTENLSQRVRELTDGRGVEVVFDMVGGSLFQAALNSLNMGGRQVAITSTGGPTVTFNLIDFYHNESRLLGVDSNVLSMDEAGQIARELVSGFDLGVLSAPEIKSVPFENAIEAYETLLAGKAKTKQVLSFE